MLQPLSVLFILATLLGLILSLFPGSRRSHTWWVAGLAITGLLHLVLDGFHESLVPAYVVATLLLVLGLRRRRPSGTGKGPAILRVGWSLAWRLVSVVLLACSALLTLTFGRSEGLLRQLSADCRADFSHLGWAEAFDELNTYLAQTYAFGNWKGIDWGALRSQFAPRIASAEQAGDREAYYLALRQYVFSFRDGHVGLSGDDLGLRQRAVGGSLGFAVAQLDDGRVIAYLIDPEGPAALAGMTWGAEILDWNGQSVLSALEGVTTLWSAVPVATHEAIRLRKLNLLTRAPEGGQVTVSFRNQGEATLRRASLIAVADSLELYRKSLTIEPESHPIDLSTPPVQWRILPTGYGYLRIRIEIPTFGGLDPVGRVRDAVEAFNAAAVPGVVIDVRSNPGGSDVMAPGMMAYFIEKPRLFEQIAYKSAGGPLKVLGQIYLTPAPIIFTGPVAMLIDNRTLSTGEGFPLIMTTSRRGPVVGFSGTAGSMGMTGSSVKLPGGYTVDYPSGASLNEEGRIQGDSDRSLEGGFQPDVRIPTTLENLRRVFVDGRDVALEEAVAVLESTRNAGHR